jgi:hypothetical protein
MKDKGRSKDSRMRDSVLADQLALNELYSSIKFL